MDFLKLCFEALKLTACQIAILILPGVILARFLNRMSYSIEVFLSGLLTRRGYLYLFGWLGITIHELGHAIMCVIFRYKITRIKLFTLDPRAQEQGVLEYCYNSKSLYQSLGSFFVGIGPVLVGCLLLYFSAYFLMRDALHLPFGDQTKIWECFAGLVKNLVRVQNLKRWEFWLFLYVSIAVSSSLGMSAQDFDRAKSGFYVLSIILFCLNLLFFEMNGKPLHPLPFPPVFAFLYAAMGFAWVFSLVFYLVFLLFKNRLFESEALVERTHR